MRKKQIRVPTILAFLFIFLLIFLSTVFLPKLNNFFNPETPSLTPQSLRITNLSDTKFTVSFLTQEKTKALIEYGPSINLGSKAYSDQSLFSGREEASNIHYFTLTNLTPSTSYYFKIKIGKKSYGSKGNPSKISNSCLDYLEVKEDSSPFIVTTLPGKMVSCRESPLNGEIVTEKKIPAEGAIVCIEIENLLPISDYVKKNGKWVIPCFNLALKDKSGFLEKLEGEKKEIIYIESPDGKKTKVINKTANDNPVPLISLDKGEYDLTASPLLAPLNIPTASLSPTSSPLTENPEKIIRPTIPNVPLILIYPSDDITDDLPTFRGKGRPGQVLKIEINSDKPIVATVIVDGNGNWSYTPPKNLSFGKHTVTITSIDEYGNQQLITKVFNIVAKNPLLPLTSGTQSGVLKTPTPSKTPTPTQKLSASPTISYNPTATPYPSPTAEPTYPEEETTNSGELMNTANPLPFIIFLTFAFIFITIGLRPIFKK